MKKWIFLGAMMLGFFAANAQTAQPIRLIVRGDDMGMTHSVNLACMEAARVGIMTSIEIIVPSPWFPEAVKLLKEVPNMDVGVHIVLTSEWENLKWRPLTYAPSITDANGYFFPMIWPNNNYGPAFALKEQPWKLEEIEQEVRAQIEMAKKHIPQLSHVSYHMGCNHIDGKVDAAIKKIAEEFGLAIFPEELGFKGVRYDGLKDTPAQKEASFIKMLENWSRAIGSLWTTPASTMPKCGPCIMLVTQT